MGSVLAILHRCRRPDRDRHAYRLACLAVIATCLFAALLLLTFPETNLLKANPSLYRRLEEMVVFWQ